MTQELRHEEMQEMLPEAALEVLEGTDLERLQAHLAECPACVHLLSQYRDAAAKLALQLPARGFDPARSAGIRNSLLARARAGRGARPSRRPEIDQWLGWMVAAGVAGVLLVHHSVHRTVDYGWLVAGVLAFVLVGVGLYARKQRRKAADLQRRMDRDRSNL